MYRYLILLLILLSSATSCNKSGGDEGYRIEPNLDYGNNDNLYTINFSSGGISRVADGEFQQGDNISVVGYNGDMTNIASYFYDGALFVSSSPISYESESAYSLSYVAAYPVVDTLSRSFLFSVAANQSTLDSLSRSDLLIAIVEPTTSITPQLNFAHVMSSVAITMEVIDGHGNDITSEISMSEIEIPLLRSALCDIDAVSYVASSVLADPIYPFIDGNMMKFVVPAQYLAKGFMSLQLNGERYSIANDAMQLLAGKYYDLTWRINIETKQQEVSQFEGFIDPWEDGNLLDEEDEEDDDDEEPQQPNTHGSVTITLDSFGLDLDDGMTLAKELSLGVIEMRTSSVGRVVQGQFSYSYGSITFESRGLPITSISFDGSISATADVGAFSSDYVWTGDASKVIFNITTSAIPTLFTAVTIEY